MSEINANYETQERYLGKVGNDMYYAKPIVPQTPTIRTKPPTDEIDAIIQAFDSVDIRKADDAQLRAYMNVAYDSYIYAEALINKRERMRTNK